MRQQFLKRVCQGLLAGFLLGINLGGMAYCDANKRATAQVQQSVAEGKTPANLKEYVIGCHMEGKIEAFLIILPLLGSIAGGFIVAVFSLLKLAERRGEP